MAKNKGHIDINGTAEINGIGALATGDGSIVNLNGSNNVIRAGRTGGLAAFDKGVVNIAGTTKIEVKDIRYLDSKNVVQTSGSHDSTTPFYASGGGKIKRGKPSTGCARRMFSGLFLYAAPEITPLSKAIYSLERMFANSGLYDLLSEKDLQTLYIDDVDIITEKIYDPHFTNLTVNGIIFSVYYTSNGM